MSSPKPSLNRCAIVTGAGQGLGRAIALRLAQDGYDIAVNDLASKSEALNAVAEEIRATGRKSIAVTGDVSQEQDVQTLVDRTVEELGILYVMVANAGIGGSSGKVIDTTLDTWNHFMSINVTGVFLCYRAAGRQMLKQGLGGRIIGASSVYGKRAWPLKSAYSTTKFAVRGLTQAMASEVAKEGITVNAYAPGYIDTPLLEEAAKNHSARTGLPIETMAETLKKEFPMGRFGTTDNVAALVSYIASDEADFMTGQSVSMNGGMFYD